MSEKTQKATFGAAEQKKPVEKSQKREEEVAVIWTRQDKNGNLYHSLKIKFDDEMLDKVFKEKELNMKLFKNKDKTPGDSKPDTIGYKSTQKKT